MEQAPITEEQRKIIMPLIPHVLLQGCIQPPEVRASMHKKRMETGGKLTIGFLNNSKTLFAEADANKDNLLDEAEFMIFHGKIHMLVMAEHGHYPMESDDFVKLTFKCVN